MKTVSAALLAHITGTVRTTCTLWKVTRKDGQVFGFTDHDVDVLFGGLVYESAIGYTSSAIAMTADLSTSNMELNALLDTGLVNLADVEAGLWTNAAVLIGLVNYADLTMGMLTLTSGVLGQFTLNDGQFTVELRNLSQIMQQNIGDTYSPSCRATLGDIKCKVSLTALTASAAVTSASSSKMIFGASSLTQVGPTVGYTDSVGQKIPTTAPYTISIVPPTGGAFVANTQVTNNAGNTWTQVSSAPGDKQYTVDAFGNYTFNGDQAGDEVFIDYTYSIGYFAYGSVKFTSGQNAGYSQEVRSFAPGAVTLALPMRFPIAVGDTFTIIAGCDRLMGTCKTRFNNLANFRGEPYIPGTDTITRSQGS